MTVFDAILTSRQGNLRMVTKHHTTLLTFRSCYMIQLAILNVFFDLVALGDLSFTGY